MTWKTIVAAAFVAVICVAGAKADDASWLADRQSAFAKWRATHANADERIARLKRETAELVAHRRLVSAKTDKTVIHRVKGAVTTIWDAPEAPRMAVIPAGSFLMGSPSTEPNRQDREGPRHRVTINYAFSLGINDVPRDEFAAFVADTNRPDPENCHVWDESTGQFVAAKGASWRNPGFAQTGSDPAVCVGWSEGRDYAAWLSRKTGKHYRLPSEAEWEYAARAGTTTVRYWGDGISRDDANYGADEGYRPWAEGRDRWLFTSPSGSFPPNAFGLYDMFGNGWQRVDDCVNPSYIGAPTDGSAWLVGDCAVRVGKGGSFASPPGDLRAAFRGRDGMTDHWSNGVFRVARDL